VTSSLKPPAFATDTSGVIFIGHPVGRVMKLLRTIAAITLSTSLLAACGGGGGAVSTPVGETGGTSSRVAFDGSVGDGPVVGATVSIRDRNFQLLATTSSTDRASFNFDGEIADSAFPLIIEATEGTDLVTNAAPDFVLSGVVMTPSQTRVNLTPHTTMMVKSALAMEGGLTQANLERARSAVTTRLNFGLDTSKVPDPMSAEVTIDNVTEVTLSSEVFGEMARRTAYWIGGNVSEDDIFTALAADLVDSALDGRGAEGTVARYTAIAHVVSAQVLIEAMLDGLQVNNQPANAALDSAINRVLSTADRSVRRSVSEVNVNSLMLSQAQAALAAAQAIDPNIPLGDLLSLLSGLQNGTAGNAGEALSNAGVDSSLSNGLDQTISIVANSNNSGVEQVNQVASGSSSGSNSSNSGSEVASASTSTGGGVTSSGAGGSTTAGDSSGNVPTGGSSGESGSSTSSGSSGDGAGSSAGNSGETLYVDIQLPGDCASYSIAKRNCSGNDGDAYPSIRDAIAVAQVGQTVLVRSGIYPVASSDEVVIDVQGLTLAGYGDERPVIEGAGFPYDAQSNERTTLLRIAADDVTVRQFEIRECPYECAGFNKDVSGALVEEIYAHHGWYSLFRIRGSHNTLRYSEFAHSAHGGGVMIRPDDQSVPINENLVYRVISHHNGRYSDGRKSPEVPGDPGGGGNSDGMGASKFCSDNLSSNVCRRNKVVEVIVWHNADDGFDFSMSESLYQGLISFDNGPAGQRNYKILRGEDQAANANTYLGCVSLGTGSPEHCSLNECPLRGFELRGAANAYHILATGAGSHNFMGASATGEVVNSVAWGASDFTYGSNMSHQANSEVSGGLSRFVPNLDLPEGISIRERWAYMHNQFRSAFTPPAGSALIDAGVHLSAIHCPEPGPGDGECREWSGQAPDIGAFESGL